VGEGRGDEGHGVEMCFQHHLRRVSTARRP
jgi:hypothetical protein